MGSTIMPLLSDADVGLQQPQAAPQQQVPMLPGASQPLAPSRTPNITAQTQPQQPPIQQPPQQAPRLMSDAEVGLGQQAPQAASGNSWGGAGKALRQGLVNAASGVAGLPGDITNLVTGGAHGSGFGSEAIQKGIEGYTGHYDPQTRLEKFIRTGAEFLPGAALPAGDIGLGAKLLRMVAAPAIGSEAAGQLTEGTAAEPYARIAGGVAGGLAGSRIGSALDARSVARANPLQDADSLHGESNAFYQGPQMDTTFKRSAVNDLKNQMQSSLGNLADPQMNTQTARLINGVGGPGLNSLKFGTLQNTRTLLGQLGGKFSDPLEQTAAGRAKDAFDTWIGNLKQSDLLSNGDINVFKQSLSNAQGNLFAAKTLDVLTGKEYAADLSAAAANSGANYENALRQRVKGILLSPAQRSRFEQIPGAIPAMESMVRGGSSDNLIRILGNLMGGGGGLGATVAGLGGFLSGAGPAGLAAPLAGAGLKALSNRIIGNKIGRLSDMVTQSAPANQPIMQARNALLQRMQGMPPAQRALVNAALGQSQLPLTQQQ